MLGVTTHWERKKNILVATGFESFEIMDNGKARPYTIIDHVSMKKLSALHRSSYSHLWSVAKESSHRAETKAIGDVSSQFW
jgi:hypothetical protein